MAQLDYLVATSNNIIKRIAFYPIILFFVLLLVQVPDVLAQYASAEPDVFVQSVEKQKAESQSVSRARLKQAGKSNIPVTSILLNPLSIEERETIRSTTVQHDTAKKKKAGVGRPVPSPYCDPIDPGLFHWISLPEGGHVAVFSLKSPEAAALRVEIKIIHMPKGTELRFYSPNNSEEVYGPFLIDQIRRQMVGKSFWSPVIESDSIAVEIFLPEGLDYNDLSIAFPQVSHFWSSVLKPYGEKRLSEIGESGYCNIDIACTDWAGSFAERSVAKMIFTKGGDTYYCTGTVLNDKDQTTSIPYFLTAHHCISTQAAASSLITYWNFKKPSCYGPNPLTVTQLTGGAKLLSTGSSPDYTLLRLYQDPPSGTGLAGWTADPIGYGSEVVGIHHPYGDLKKINFGTALGFSYCTPGVPFNCYPREGGYTDVIWDRGVTEPGSSGSPLFDDQGHVIGILKGGRSTCQEPYLEDYYSRFDRTYPLIKQWIGEISASDQPPIGHVDYVNETQVAGWAYDPDDPNQSIDVHVYIDGDFIGSTAANLERPDIGLSYPYHGFNYNLPELSPGTHSVKIYAIDNDPTGTNPLLKGANDVVIPTPATACASADESLTIIVPCLHYDGVTYRVILERYFNADDPVGIYWKLSDVQTTTCDCAGECSVVDENLNIDISCVEYGDLEFTANLEAHANMNDHFGLYWKLGSVNLK